MKTLNQLFDNYSTAKNVVMQLEAAGIPYKDISIVSHHAENRSEAGEGAGVGAGVGAALGAGGGLLAGLGMIAIPGIGPVVAAGWLSATLAGAVGGAVAGGAAGGLIGALIDSGVPDDEAHVYAEGVRRGGALVSVKVDDEKAPVARRILADAGGVDVNTRRQFYREQGWERFDHTSAPYTPEDVELERQKLLNMR
ncbi:hypothetical protein FHS77_002472 [Paenochrobactrum gallinarii]|uniref:Low temperature-induced protein n=1 Tax=Paenochrobactrum gallinarii TaxID=643673 RepID=A0A841LUB6_9HYPH|nr:hypothetical protein [Paenochrobactrum gallinarii]MBB6261905.1 hypothetical protein [Paenochrobactrum gallinarii]